MDAFYRLNVCLGVAPTADALSRDVPNHAQDCYRAALAGDIEEAVSLSVAVPKPLRGAIAAAMFAENTPTEAYREFLRGAWDTAHEYVRLGAELIEQPLEALFRRAQFAIPATIPHEVTIWRGGRCHTTRTLVRCGPSWTLDRATACWFAVYGAVGGNGAAPPRVIKAKVARSDLIYVSNDRDEQEVIPGDLIRARIDGNPDIWAREADAWLKRRKAREAKLLSGLACTVPGGGSE